MPEYHQIEEALKECEEKFSKAFRESPLILTLTRAKDHRYIDVNDTFERITGWNRDEVIGRTPFDLAIWVDPSQRLDFVKRLLAGDTVRNLEVRARMKDGKIRTISGSAVLIKIKDETCVLSLIADITGLKTAEEAKRLAEQQAEEANRVAERLSSMARKLIQAHDDERASIAQELHNHIDRLAVVSMVLHRLRQNPPGSMAEGSQEIAKAIRQIEDLVSDIQTLSQRLHSSRLEYLGLAAAAAEFCKEFAHQKEVKVAFASGGIPEGLLKESSVCLFHILQEALQNASEHSASREFEVSLNTELDDIHLSVLDSEGIGFDPEEALEGSGFGLTIMRERLKIVGGGIWIESQAGRGTTIHARVPIKPRINSANAGAG
jgi:PAS domain S-box-containing protein